MIFRQLFLLSNLFIALFSPNVFIWAIAVLFQFTFDHFNLF
ncbi:hypothetical protein TREVI0001_0230 [Treponema vincentii ATCC 35580]|uniref:Uncharacterized protein n=1 Tax=Treponema vincentii ATCC 35580 TaxID=596324 RepID=C8PTY8_9SPIR|nr:hypothetical protein TREVI0001_0230 [Treponema vincentii ATCC 35580]